MALLGAMRRLHASLFLMATVLLRTTMTLTADCEGCQAASWTSDGAKIETTCKRISTSNGLSCRSLHENSTEPLALRDFLMQLHPGGKGFNASWFSEIKQGTLDQQASFVIERLFKYRNECITIITETATANFQKDVNKVWFGVSCNENITDTVSYELHAYSLPDIFRRSTEYSFHGTVKIPEVNWLVQSNRDVFEETKAALSGPSARPTFGFTSNSTKLKQRQRRYNHAFHINRSLNSGIWQPSVLFHEKEIRCSTTERNISVTFTPPTTMYPLYEVILCINSDCSSEREEDKQVNVNGNVANFDRLSVGEYGVRIAPEGYRNAVENMKYVVKGGRIWNPDVNVDFSCVTSEVTCRAKVSFTCPDPEFEFINYTICFQRNGSQDEYCKDVINECKKLKISADFLGLSKGIYKLTISASSNCHLWNSTYSKDITISGGSPTVMAGEARESKANAMELLYIIIPAVAVSATLGFLVHWRYRACIRRLSTTAKQSRKETKALDAPVTEYDTVDESSFLGLVCGRRPKVLLLYAQDHEQHVRMVKCLSEILVTYGGCHVEGDSYFNDSEMYNNNWLKNYVSEADAVFVVDSPAACLIYDAFLSNRFYRKYEKEFPTHYNLLAVLSYAEKTPYMKQRIARITTSYSYSKSASSIATLGLKQFALPKDLCELLYFAYGTDQTLGHWPCKEHCLNSPLYQKMTQHLVQMEQAMHEDPNHFQCVYGPLENNTDSGFSASVYEQWLQGSINAPAGGTDVVTIGESPCLDYQYGRTETSEYLRTVEHELSTAMPNVEDTWRQFANPEASHDDRLISAEGLRLILQRMNSVPQNGALKSPSGVSGDRDAVDDSNYSSLLQFLSKEGDVARDDVDTASCVTLRT